MSKSADELHILSRNSREVVWCDWYWNQVHQCFERYRENEDGSVDYDYDYEGWCRANVLEDSLSNQPSTATTTLKCSHPACSDVFERVEDRDRHFKHMHSNQGARPFSCTFPACSAGVRSWTKESGRQRHNKIWHGPYPCKILGCNRSFPNGFATSEELAEHSSTFHELASEIISETESSSRTPHQSVEQPEVSQHRQTFVPDFTWSMDFLGLGRIRKKTDDLIEKGEESKFPESYHAYPSTTLPHRSIRTRDPSLDSDALDTRYSVHHSAEFQFGKIFKVLWSEPTGSRGTIITEIQPSRHLSYQKIRRFVIISEREGHSICLPILTYGGKGLLKAGAHARDHAVIYSGNRPTIFKGEGITRDNIHCKMNSKAEKLDPASRLNYAKLYTVEHNVKVWFIGRVSESHEQRLVIGYNDVHPPLPNRSTVDGNQVVQLDSLEVEDYTYWPKFRGDEGAIPSPPTGMPKSDLQASDSNDCRSSETVDDDGIKRSTSIARE